MKPNMNTIKHIVFCIVILLCYKSKAQRGYQKDSIQVKVYTEMVISKTIELDTITVKKVFCSYCSKPQIKAIEKQSLAMTYDMRMEPKYRKQGEHRIALYIRIPRHKFEELNNSEPNKNE